MILFNSIDNSLSPVRKSPFKLEKEMQTLVELNLSKVFNLTLVQSEYQIRNRRIDSLCYDESNSSFVIVEYKNKENYSVIDQGFSYLSLLLNNKSDFVLSLSHHFGKVFKIEDIDWSLSKVIFIAPKYSSFQKESVNFRDIPFELWEITRFENGLVGFTQHMNDSSEKISNNIKLAEDSVISNVTKEVKVYDEEYLLNKAERNESLFEFYDRLRERILSFGDVSIKANGKWINFYNGSDLFLSVVLYTVNQLQLVLNLKKGQLEDSKNRFEIYDSDSRHWGTGDYNTWINTDEEDDFEYLITCVKQAYQDKSGLHFI